MPIVEALRYIPQVDADIFEEPADDDADLFEEPVDGVVMRLTLFALGRNA